MRTTKSKLMLLCVLLLLVLITGCLNKTAVLTTLEITPKEISLDVGQTQEFTVVGKDENGNVMDVTPSWGVTGEIGAISSTEGKLVAFKATTYGSGTVKVIAEDITVTAQINVELTESRVNSFMQTYGELYHNQDAEGLGNLHSDPCTVIYNDTSYELSRNDLIDGFIGNFNKDKGEYTIDDWEITFNENVASVIISPTLKTETYTVTSRSELTIKNLEGDLFIFVLKDLYEG